MNTRKQIVNCLLKIHEYTIHENLKNCKALVAISTEQCVRILVHRQCVYCVTICSCSPIEMQIRLLGARETISVISQAKACYISTTYVQRTVYRSNVCTVLALYSFYPPEPKCITQSKTQMSQINFAKEPNLAPEPRCGQP